MTRVNGGPRLVVENWIAESLRVSTFHAPETLANVRDFWQLAVGAPAEAAVQNRRLGIDAHQGRYGEAMLVLQVQRMLGRIDWVIGLVPGTEENPTSKFIPLLNEFSPLVERWLPECPPAKRLAFGAALAAPVPGFGDGHCILSNYLNFDIDEGINSDFHYQANRQTDSIVPGLRINRLTKWSVAQFVLQTISIGATGAEVILDTPEPQTFCKLELDINTALLPGDNAVLPPERLLELWRQELEIGRRIVADGDVP